MYVSERAMYVREFGDARNESMIYFLEWGMYARESFVSGRCAFVSWLFTVHGGRCAFVNERYIFVIDRCTIVNRRCTIVNWR